MAERVDCGICGAFQSEGGNDTFRSYRKNSIPRQVSTDNNYYDLGRLESPLELRPSAFKEGDSRGANRLSIWESGTLNREYHGNMTKYKFVSINSEPHILRSSIETEGKRCEIHDGLVDSLSSASECEGSKDKNGEHADVTLGKECDGCPNSGTIERTQASFGKLRRIGSPGGDVWKKIVPQKTCRSIHAHSRYPEEVSSKTGSHGSMSQVRLCEDKNGRTSSCNDPLILVDTFEDKSRIATLIDYKVLNSDPEELIYYIRRVAEFGFDHIIIIGETKYGMIFLDCYGRVFQWDDEGQMLWPLGNSPEEVPKRLIKGEDQLRWFVANGIVYEYITKWQDFY
ncbi:12519_t:CDS:2 [Funneliformis geosporum]|uniref:15843_t:CDS:1 n=1 Tax=Funneliformis geosporum TaxID=1117311 RepID=A0A9W4SAK5_9GLOM|nr:12519_t:CDS:2 [Funneliformis geosporum]CAI2162806.1 15843_t:CDS:2 [Funneliformis geosporum]